MGDFFLKAYLIWAAWPTIGQHDSWQSKPSCYLVAIPDFAVLIRWPYLFYFCLFTPKGSNVATPAFKIVLGKVVMLLLCEATMGKGLWKNAVLLPQCWRRTSSPILWLVQLERGKRTSKYQFGQRLLLPSPLKSAKSGEHDKDMKRRVQMLKRTNVGMEYGYCQAP